MELHAQIACNMPRELAKRGATWQDRAVYCEAILYCRENLTDGLISRGELPFWMPDMAPRTRAQRLDSLTTSGLLVLVDEGWRFPEHVWRKWNPTKAEVDAKRAEDAARKAEWRARKRAASTNDPNNVPAGQPQDINGTHLSRDANATTCPRQPEPEPEPEPEEEGLTYSRSLTGVVAELTERFRA